MSPRRLIASALALPALAAASTALAQGAPGACDDCVVVAAAPAPVYVAAPRPTEVDLSRRLGVGLHLASLAIADHDDPDADPTELGGGGLQVSYRFTRRWEVELDVATLRQHDDDGEPFGDDLHMATLGARFHLRPGRHLDWFVSGGFGGIHVGDHEDHGDAEDGRALGYLGIGLEYRWQRFALGAELRGIGIAPAEAHDGDARMQVPDDDRDDEGDGAASFSAAATYYF